MKKNKNHAIFSVSMVIPTYNSGRETTVEITKAIVFLRKNVKDFEVIISDDCSTDDTHTFLKEKFSHVPYISLVRNKKNLGIAGNVKKLYKLAKKDMILFYVADGDWEADAVEKLIQKAKQTNADVVIGKRTHKGGYTIYRKLVSFLHNFLPLLLFGVDTIDAGSLKMYRRSYFTKLNLLSTSVFVDAEIIIKLKKLGAKVVSTPIIYKKPIVSSGVAAKPIVVISSLFDMIRLRLSFISF